MGKQARGHTFNPNTPFFCKEEQKKPVLNTTIAQYANEVFTLISKGQTKGFDVAYLDFQSRFNINEGKGILYDMSREYKPVNYTTIQMENFSLQELEEQRLWEFTTDTVLPTKIEKAIVRYIKSEIVKNGFPKELKADFVEALKYHNENISDLLSTIKNFSDQINTPQQKKLYEQRIKTLTLSMRGIIAQLESDGNDRSEFKTKDYKDWDLDQQQFTDHFITKLLLSRLDKRIQAAKNLIYEVKDTFSKVIPPFKTIFQYHPINIQEFLQKNPTTAEVFNQLMEQKKTAQTEQEHTDLDQQIYSLSWDLYLQDLQGKNPQLASYLTDLKKSDFDFSQLADKQGFFNLLVQFRREQMEKNQILPLFGTNITAFKDFFNTLFDLQSQELSINGYTLPIKKTIIPGSHPELRNPQEATLFDALPLEYEIDLSTAQFSIEDRAFFEALFKDRKKEGKDTLFVLTGNDIGRMMYLFWNQQNSDSIFDAHNPKPLQQKLISFFDNQDQKSDLPQIPEHHDSHPKAPEFGDDEKEKPSQPENIPLSKEQQLQEFYEAWKSIGGMQGKAPDFGFKKGATIYVAMEESILPPYGIGSNSRIKMEIVGIQTDATPPTFQIKSMGSERKLHSEEEGKIRDLEMTKDRIESLFVKGNGELIAPSQKILEDSSDFNQQVEQFQQAHMCSEHLLGDAHFKDGKFMMKPKHLDGSIGEEQEVSYFGTTDTVPDPKGSKLKKYNILYKVQHNPDHTFTVSSDFIDLEGNAKTYTHKMTYSDFIFFLNEKKLSPKTASQAEEEQKASQDVISSHTRTWKFVSIQSLIFGIKNVWKNLTDKLDEYQKEQDEAFLDYLVSDVGIYKVIGNTFGFIPSIKDATNRLHEDVLLKKESNTRKSIDDWIKKFQSMQDYANLFENGYDHPNGYTLDAIIGKGNTLQKILLSGKSVVDDDGLRPIMAAAMIANLRQGKGLYRGLSGKDNQGLWVKCLLGDAHYIRYRAKREEVLAQIKNGVKNADQLQDQLKKSEIDYIINNIRNSNGTEGAFGSIDDGNKQILKQLYSDKFAGELESAANDMCGKAAIEGAYGKIAHNNFNIAANDFNRFIKSGRIESALANLKKMGDLATTNEQQRKLKIAMSYVVLSGIMNRYGDKATRKWFDALARTYMLPTAFFAKKWDNQHYAVHLLDQIFPQPDKRNFLLSTGYKITDFDESSPNIPYGKLVDALDLWRREHSEKIDEYFKGLKSKDCSDDPILKEIQDKLREKNEDNLDGDWAGNSGITGHYAMLASPSTIRRNKSYDRSGFTGKDVDEKNDKADFWKSVLQDLRKVEHYDHGAEFLLKQFITWFVPSEGEYPEMISRIRTANMIQNYGTGKSIHFPIQSETGITKKFSTLCGYKGRESSDILWYLFQGKVLRGNSALPPDEFKEILDFFHQFFSSHLEEIAQDGLLEKIFGSTMIKSSESHPVTLIPWEEYNKYVDKNNPFGDFNQQKGGTQQEKEERQRKKRYYRSGLFLNESLVALEKEMNRIGIPNTPQLSGLDDNLADDIYRHSYNITT